MSEQRFNQQPGQQGGFRRDGGGQPPRDREPSEEMVKLLGKIILAEPDVDLFDDTAEAIAKELGACSKVSRPERNKSSQLRRFYDEIVMWDQRIRQSENKEADYRRYLPLIKMLNAKATYAQERQLVDVNFVALLKHGLRQLSADKPEHFQQFKLFMEAFMGFYKLHGPK